PGSGFITSTRSEPVGAASPVAVNVLPETKVVVSGVPSSRAMAPGTEPLPFSFNVNGPNGMVEGLADAKVGKGFKSSTVAVANTAGAATLVAFTITIPPPGIAAGGT